MPRILVAGCGYVGARLAHLLTSRGHQVWGLRRRPGGLPEGVRGVAADVTKPASLTAVPRDVDSLVYAVSPAGSDPSAYRAAYVEGFQNVALAVRSRSSAPIRTLLVTSTGVYGYTDGRWVDEETPAGPADATGEILLEAEARLREVAPDGVVLRLGGIYGPGRTRTVRRVLDGVAGCPPPDRYGNRIHRDDAAGALAFLLTLERPRPVYLGVDREPAAKREVYRWLATRAGVRDPCEGPEAETWEARGRRGTNKRCRSDRLVEDGFTFRYPTYREGYGPLVDRLSAERRPSPSPRGR